MGPGPLHGSSDQIVQKLNIKIKILMHLPRLTNWAGRNREDAPKEASIAQDDPVPRHGEEPCRTQSGSQEE